MFQLDFNTMYMYTHILCTYVRVCVCVCVYTHWWATLKDRPVYGRAVIESTSERQTPAGFGLRLLYTIFAVAGKEK